MDTIVGGADLSDDTLDAVVHLTGDGAVPVLTAAVAAVGATLGTASITQVDHDPGNSCTVSYQAALDWPDGRHSDELFVATTSTSGPPEGSAVLTAGDLTVAVWRWPYDPSLPGLADAVLADRLAVRLSHVGPGPWHPKVIAYRPGRRAVVRADSEHGSVFLKLVRPDRADALAARHVELHGAGLRVPELIAADLADGFLVLRALEGAPMRDLLVGQAATPLSATAIDDLRATLDGMSGVRLDGRPARRRPLDDVASHAAVVSAVLPSAAARVEELVERLDGARCGDTSAIGAGVTVHGDLHDAQLLFDDRGRFSGLIDLDDVGTGARADDLGNLWGHAATMALVAPGARSAEWSAAVHRLVGASGCDVHQVARRAAAVTLSLATGPFRVREDGWQAATMRRIGLAEELLAVREVSHRDHGHLIPVDEN